MASHPLLGEILRPRGSKPTHVLPGVLQQSALWVATTGMRLIISILTVYNHNATEPGFPSPYRPS